jgi:GNAT superfamily N-acetyltransferase
MSDLIVSTTPLDPRARPLVDDLIHEYDSRYGELFNPGGAVVELHRYPPEAFAAPDGHFLLLLRDGETIGGGAFKRYDAHTAEFKRVWTRRDLRRQGLASTVLAALEDAARRQHYRRVYLTTGCRQPEAMGLYLRRGYTALFDQNADLEALRTLPFEKQLTVAAEAVLAPATG